MQKDIESGKKGLKKQKSKSETKENEMALLKDEPKDDKEPLIKKQVS
jgi:cell division protein FtsB